MIWRASVFAIGATVGVDAATPAATCSTYTCSTVGWTKKTTAGVDKLTASESNCCEAPTFRVSNTVCNAQQTERAVCKGPPCDGCVPQNCVLSQWSSWTSPNDCNGLSLRTRTVKTPNNRCGDGCKGNLKETKKVTVPTSCTNPNQDCRTADWSQYSKCADRFDQAVSTQKIIMNAHGTGKGCTAPLKQTKACGEKAAKVDCIFADWSAWTKCSKTCGGGFQSRNRLIKEKSSILGTPCKGDMNNFQVCSSQACPQPRPCKWAAWTQWAGCDVTDKYQMVRRRTIEAPPAGTAQEACIGATRETKGCDLTRQPVNCVLSDWSSFGHCTKTCDGGQKTRYRGLNIPPKNGGTCPTADLIETVACSENPCKPNICVYTTWDTWEACSAKCGPGTTQRSRTVDTTKTKAADGGCTGAVKEVKPCQTKACDVADCVWANWQSWSGCTASCGGGTKRRHRFIKTAPANGGTLCEKHKKGEIVACNTQPCQKGCVDGAWQEWKEWGACSKTCGGAYQSRHRTVLKAANYCGKPVEGPFDEFRECINPNNGKKNPPCGTPVNCQLSQWTEWGACSASCFGIRERHRTIHTFANEYGKACEGDNGMLKQIEGCNPVPGGAPYRTCDATPARDCRLEEWSEWSACPVTCGGGQQYRARHVLSPPSHNGKVCNKRVSETRLCTGAAGQPCARNCIDCEFSPWSSWGACSSCKGQKWRTRAIKTHNNYCGKPCTAQPVKETADCTSAAGCAAQSLVFCGWTEWTVYEDCTYGAGECGPASRKRQRSLHLMNVDPGWDNYLFSGKAPITCSATDFKSEACPLKKCATTCSPKANCAFAGWSEWHPNRCTGIDTRNRVMTVAGACGGQICNDNLIESKSVPNACTEKQDCVWDDWGAWTPCHKQGQQTHRARSIHKMPQAGGKPCSGTRVETKPCIKVTVAHVDCQFQEWFPWSACSVSCGVGWQMRNRATIPADGGKPCTGQLKQLQACDITDNAKCGFAAPGTPCKMDGWSEWSMCLATGERSRVRHIVTMGREGAKGCSGSLEEIGGCGPYTKDCQLSEWSQWSSCDHTCGGGQQSRTRQLLQPAQGGGKACTNDLLDMRPCNENACGKDACELNQWGAWSSCTANCGMGQQTRTRTVKKDRVDKGIGCIADLEEQKSCDTGKKCPATDCQYGSWTAWGACNKQCGGGQQTRKRVIVIAAQAGGKPCPVLANEETQACNAQTCGNQCVDGKFEQWGAWTKCSTSCMGGIQSRKRGVATRANSCGNPVNGITHQVRSCWTNAPCDKPPADCEFSKWTEWSACSATCLGERTRTRSIKTEGRGSGKFCTGALNQVEPCNPGKTGTLDPKCPVGKAPIDCVQSAWTTWSTCSATCGGGQHSKTRKVTTMPRLGGKECPSKYMKWTEPCGTTPCTKKEVDCTYASWSAWSGCDACNGQRSRTRTVTHPTPKGKACRAKATSLAETEKCVSQRSCAGKRHFCVWGQWSAYTSCTFAAATQCGTGYKTRTRSMKASTSPPQTLRLYDSEMSAEEQRLFISADGAKDEEEDTERLQRIAFAFIAGGGAVGLVMMVLQLGQRSRTQDLSSRGSYAGLHSDGIQ